MKEFEFKAPRIEDFKTLREALIGVGGDEKAMLKPILACEEIFVNIVSYSGATKIRVTLEAEGDCVYVTFFDDGISFDPTKYSNSKDFEELSSGGMGISMVLNIAKEVSYRREKDGNLLKLKLGGQSDAR